MDVSIAVTLIRGQMGAVVERAVNGAVETVLSEMLKVVGVKFEELKAQVALMKRDMAALQREKALKEKENENIRAKLRYTELKLKYYRQGVEEELQQRLSASALVRIDPSTFHPAQRGGVGVSSAENTPVGSSQSWNSEGAQSRRSQEGERAPSRDEDDCEWTVTPLTHTDAVDAIMAPPAAQNLAVDVGQQPLASSVSPQADSSTLPSPAPQVKQEVEEVICIKEEPEEEEVMATLLLDCKVEQGHLPEPEAQGSATEPAGPPANLGNPIPTFSSAGPNTYVMLQPASSLLTTVALPPSMVPRPAARPWSKDLRLYEEYKLRRNELRLRSLNRRREQEKTVPQPLLSDIVRERREKTRLRVARWRAKRKLQACLDQAQAVGGAAGLLQRDSPITASLQPPSAAASTDQQRQSSAVPPSNRISTRRPFVPSTSSASSSSSVLLRPANVSPHLHPTVTSSSSSFPQASVSQQGGSVMDSDILH